MSHSACGSQRTTLELVPSLHLYVVSRDEAQFARLVWQVLLPTKLPHWSHTHFQAKFKAAAMGKPKPLRPLTSKKSIKKQLLSILYCVSCLCTRLAFN